MGTVAFPCLRGANFGEALMADAIFGTLGAAMKDVSSGCQIQDNMNVMQQCISMTSQQLGLVNAVQSAVTATVQQIQSCVQQIDEQILAERTHIFNAARESV